MLSMLDKIPLMSRKLVIPWVLEIWRQFYLMPNLPKHQAAVHNLEGPAASLAKDIAVMSCQAQYL